MAQIKLGAILNEAQSPAAEAAVHEIRTLLRQAIQYSRSLTFELGLPVLYDLGLEAAVEWLADQIHEQHGLPVRVTRDQQPKPLGEAASLLIFRVLRELLINVVKHADASRVEIDIHREGDHLAVRVTDDGRGFDPREAASLARRTPGYGLFSIRERLSHLGGYLDIRSGAGRGTSATVVVPLDLNKEMMVAN
jgi:signal transduction histidine kinase